VTAAGALPDLDPDDPLRNAVVAVVGATGRWSISVKPTANTMYRAVFAVLISALEGPHAPSTKITINQSFMPTPYLRTAVRGRKMAGAASDTFCPC